MLQVGDKVRTKHTEWDIEMIPAGTEIVLIRPNDVKADYWYGTTILQDRDRMVLVLAANLENC